MSPLALLVTLAFTEMAPPYIVIGPLAVTAESTLSPSVLPGLPKVKPLMVCPFWFMGNQLLLIVLEKEVLVGLTSKVPVVANEGVNELCQSTLSTAMVILDELVVKPVTPALEPQ